MATLQPHYSGRLSRTFWLRVRALPAKDRDTSYACGVLLQDMESSILRWLQNAELRRKPRKGAKKKEE